jgi:hypothetical protein
MKETVEQLSNGSWVRRRWYDETRIAQETWVCGPGDLDSLKPHGPCRQYDLDGNLIRELLAANGRAVRSIAEYDEARREDPRLPARTEPEPPHRLFQAYLIAREKDPRYQALARQESDRFSLERLRAGNPQPFAEIVSRGVLVLVGERGERESRSIVHALLRIPCKAVHALETESGNLPDGRVVVGVGEFLIELSGEAEERRKAFRTVEPWVREQGYEPSADIGQRFLFAKIK